jgi:predicted nucleic acid-binding protein
MTISLVVDASFTLKLILPNPQQAHCQSLMREWEQDGHSLYAPTLWLYEITSGFSKAVYFDLLTEAEGHKALRLAQQLNVQLIHPDDNQVRLAYEWTRRLRRAAAYDSFYLALAESLSADFWTADRRLTNAVNTSWLHCISG